MKPVKGIFSDCNPQDQPSDTYRFAKNMVDNATVGGLENEPGFTNLGALAPGSVIGIVPMRNKAAIFSVDGDTGYIGYVQRDTSNNLTYTEVYTSDELNFSTNAPIQGEYQTNLKGEDIVAWIDDINPPRLINLSNPEVNSINDLSIFLTATPPNVTITPQDSGGSLLTGSYYIIVQYEDPDGGKSAWLGIGRPVEIYDDTGASVTTDGAPAGTPTSKSILLELTEVDSNFSKINIGYVLRKNGVTSAVQIQQLDTQPTMSYVIGGAETTTDISLDEVLTPNATYTNAKAITQINNQLVLGNLGTGQIDGIQEFVNQIKIDYSWELATEIDKTVDTKGHFQSGEVYAFYFIIDLPNGGSLAYHIPGRGPASGERNLDNTTILGLLEKKYKIANTADTIGAITNMGFWENDSELYPSDFPAGLSWDGNPEALANQKVRHHRFPDMDYLIHKHTTEGTTHVGKNSLIRLGINVSNVIIPDEIKAQIVSWRIGYAKRTYNNSIVLGTDNYHSSGQPTATDDYLMGLQISTGGNFNITSYIDPTDSRFDIIRAHKDAPLLERTLNRGHCLDLQFDKPAAVPTYIRFLHLNKVGTLRDENDGYTDPNGRIADTNASNPGVIVNWTLTNNSYSPSLWQSWSLPPTSLGSVIDNYSYIPQNTTVGAFSTINSESVIRSRIIYFDSMEGVFGTKKIYDGLSEPEFVVTRDFDGLDSFRFRRSISGSVEDQEATYIFQYRQAPANVYTSYGEQTIVSLPSRVTDLAQTSNTNIFGGDCYLVPIHYICSSAHNASSNRDRTPKLFKSYVAEARHNWKLRYEDGTVSTKYYPKSPASTFWVDGVTAIPNSTTEFNKLAFNTDYDQKAEYLPVVVITDEDDFAANSAPTTIIYSEVQNLENKDVSWKTFPTGNRHVQPRNRGPITNLEGWANKEILIHHEDALFITRANLALSGDSENVNLKSSGLFDLPTQELLTTEGGYAGTQHSHACKVTKIGYVFTDDKRKKIFVYNGNDLQEISNNGIRNLFQTIMGNEIDNNPYNGEGYTSAYDELYNRLLISKKQDGSDFTLSYSDQKKCFVSFHDYIPDAMFTLDNGIVFSVKDNDFFRHNTGARGVYYGETASAAFVDFVQNMDPTSEKVYTTVQWETEVRNSSNVLQYNNTIDRITLWSIDKTTGKKTVSRLSNINNFDSQNTRTYGQIWYFNDIYDVATSPDFLLPFNQDYAIDPTKLNNNVPWYQKRKLIDKFVTCRLEYTNTGNNRLILLHADIAARQSSR